MAMNKEIRKVASAGTESSARAGPLCTSRVALITGRNHHINATGVITEIGTGFPGYNSLMSKSSGTVWGNSQAERLQHVVVRQEP